MCERTQRDHLVLGMIVCRIMTSCRHPQAVFLLLLTLVPVRGAEDIGAGGDDADLENIEHISAVREKCGKPTKEDTNLQYIPDQQYYSFGEKVEVSCSDGFEPSERFIECIRNKVSESIWDTSVTCIKKCGKPTKVDPNLQYIPDQQYYSFGDKVEVSCSDGFQPSERFVECIRNKANESIWNASVTCIRKCRKPQAHYMSPTFTPDRDFYDIDEEVTLSCPAGHQPSELTIKCIIQGDKHGWNDSSLNCIAKCKNLKTQDNPVQLHPDKLYYSRSEVVKVSCTEGYEFLWATQTISCTTPGEQREWSNTVTCIRKCKISSSWDSRLQFTPNKRFYASYESVTVSCAEGYELSQPIQPVWCERKRNGYQNDWSNTWINSVTCIEKCKNLKTQDNHIQLHPDKPYYSSYEVVNVNCTEGYEVFENIQMTSCVRLRQWYQWNQWSNTVTCIGKCKNSSRWDSRLLLTPNKRFYASSESVTVSCAEGYELSQHIQPIRCERYLNRYENRYENAWTNTLINYITCIESRSRAHVLETSASSITLRWVCDSSYYCSSDWSVYGQCEPVPRADGRCQTSVKMQLTKDKEETLTCSSLQPFSEYDITISGSNWQNLVAHLYTIRGVRTNETVPDKPTIWPQSKTTREIRWTKLSDCKGNITGYQLKIIASRDYNLTFNETMYSRTEASVTRYRLPVWKHGTNYTVEVQGQTSAGSGEAVQWGFETEIAEPIIPSDLKESNISALGATVALHIPWISDLNGPISEYQIIITYGWNRSEDDLCQQKDLPSFNATLNNETYITAAFPASNITDQRSFIIGNGDYYHGYYNAPLNPGYNYTAFLRVISVWKQDRKVSCASYGSIVVTVLPSAADSTLGLAIALSILLLLLLVVVLFMYWKLKSSRSRRKKFDGTSNGLIPLKKKRNLGKMKKEIPVTELLAAMKRSRTAEIMEEQEEGEDKERVPAGRVKEYQMLDFGLLYPCEAGMASDNRNKNRYKNIVPYDHSRVILRSSSPEEDYINASYIDGYKKPNLFIACQGPLLDTVADFWQMVWQENTSIIVMLTDLVEQNKPKCEQYWPEQCETYGDITVTLLNIRQSVGLITRMFAVQKKNSPFQKSVEQLHYLMWPDHGVPKKSAELLQLVEQMNESKALGTGPVIVHCSAGIGRTGTFIALDFLLKMAKEEKKVDVLRCTHKLRQKRVNMVQTAEQYCFLYDVLLEALLCGLTGVPVEDIQHHVKKLGVQDSVTRSDGYIREFKALEKYSEIHQLYSCREAKKPSNVAKNRNQEILPADIGRPILMSILGRDGSPGYINAVFANSYAEEDKFIITQLPLKETLPDFWALVYDYNCTTVVLMNRTQDLDESYSNFWPARGEAKHGPFHIKIIAEKPGAEFTMTTLSLTKGKKSTDSKLEIQVWEMSNWPMSKRLPESPTALISILGEVERHQQYAQESHILITCWDGASRSGLFCAGSIICEQIRTEGLVDISSAVRTVKRKRYQLIPNVEQYRFCYQLAQSYLDSFETYGNFK